MIHLHVSAFSKTLLTNINNTKIKIITVSSLLRDHKELKSIILTREEL